MTPRQKCAHCGKVTDFHDDFCTLCWSHRTKGKVLTAEQVTNCQSQFVALTQSKKYEAEFGKWQNLIVVPAILMTIWCGYWAFFGLFAFLAEAVELPELVMSIVSVVCFPLGGFLVGGRKALKIACLLLIIASLTSGIHVGTYLLDVFRGAEPVGKGLLWSSVRLILCGMTLVGSIAILRIKRPAA